VKERCFQCENIVRDDVIDEEIFKVRALFLSLMVFPSSECAWKTKEIAAGLEMREKMLLKCDLIPRKVDDEIR
jgi:hypothetical protein